MDNSVIIMGSLLLLAITYIRGFLQSRNKKDTA